MEVLSSIVERPGRILKSNHSLSFLFCDRSIYLIAITSMFLKGAAAADEKWVYDDERGRGN